MFAGQLADGLATPVVGVLSDMSNGFCGWGRRTSWLVVGAMMVMVCYDMVFGICYLRWWIPDPSKMELVVYYR